MHVGFSERKVRCVVVTCEYSSSRYSAILECRGLEKALDQIEAERSAKSGVDAAAMAKAAGIEVCKLCYCQKNRTCSPEKDAWLPRR